jgi:sarcosine oxidase subunit beta
VALELETRNLACCDRSGTRPLPAKQQKAIGGVRATHSDFGKISVCQRSIEIMRNWHETRGNDIGWMSNGYSYPATKKRHASPCKTDEGAAQLCLNIKWVSPRIQRTGPWCQYGRPLGSTYSPEDGSCSPLLMGSAYFFHALNVVSNLVSMKRSSALI